MKVQTIHATYGRKWNLDDYESAEVRLDAFAELEDGEDVQGASAALFQELKEQVAAQSAAMLVARNERRRKLVADVLDGLPKHLQEIAVNFIQSAHPDPDMLTTVSVKTGNNGKEEE